MGLNPCRRFKIREIWSTSVTPGMTPQGGARVLGVRVGEDPVSRRASVRSYNEQRHVRKPSTRAHFLNLGTLRAHTRLQVTHLAFPLSDISNSPHKHAAYPRATKQERSQKLGRDVDFASSIGVGSAYRSNTHI